MEEEFWKYWKQRWPHASSDHNKIKGSANYQETRAAFEAGYQAAQQSVQSDLLLPCGHNAVTSYLYMLGVCSVCNPEASR